MNKATNLTVIVPLFPRQDSLRHAFAALRAQTQKPDLVVLLDNGQTGDADLPEHELPGMAVQVIEADTNDPAEAINRAVDFLDHSKHISILGAGGAYAPRRLERCLAAAEDPSRFRQPGLVVTGLVPVDGQGAPLPEGSDRHAQLARLWAPGRGGVGLPEWLGAGDFVLTASNLFARRSYLLANPLVAGAASFAYHAAIQAGVQGLLEVIDEPLLEFHWSGPATARSAPGAAASLRAQIQMLGALREKLGASPETRRNFSAFHRAAWNNISGLREDLFSQAALQLASLAPEDEMVKTADRFTATGDLQEVPTHLRDLREGPSFADPATYAAALASARGELSQAREENARLSRVAEAAQESGWVRFGAWLGDRGARRIMEMDAEENASVQPPDGEVEGGGENDPQKVGNEQP